MIRSGALGVFIKREEELGRTSIRGRKSGKEAGGKACLSLFLLALVASRYVRSGKLGEGLAAGTTLTNVLVRNSGRWLLLDRAGTYE